MQRHCDVGTPAENLVTNATATLQLTRQSNKSWRSSGDDDIDPFAGLEEEFEMANDLEANLMRDKKATLCASVSGMVEKLQSDRGALLDACDELVSYQAYCNDCKVDEADRVVASI